MTIAAYEYAWNPPGAYLPMSNVGQSPIDFEVGRIDVEDVKHTLSNGQVQTVRGTYQISRIDASGNSEGAFIDGCSTNTGFDVLPGRYKVVVAYELNGKKTIENVVDVP